MDTCHCCNKTLKGRVYRCNKCSMPFCKACSVGKICKECVTLSDNTLVEEYFKQKYEEAARCV